ncbi:tRNA pseudouridine(55) synthase TruB [Candidatus Saccharibacteria bacterium]|nr:tRNA pseudouridine(55) synthase TruB [Candidatus Saccharibacteria bacterium]
MENEIILIDKPAGMSSFGVVARVRRALSERAGKKVKVGHTGTLDPFATGLLILLVGKATKRSNEFLKLDKEYIAEIKLGETSTTGDPEGEVQKSYSGEAPDFEEVKKVVQSFVGEIWQKVPAFSAVKINGRRAYEMARKGMEVETPTRKVTIYNIEILEYSYPKLVIRTEVSSGTYIRTLGEDIGRELGAGAYLTALRRTRIKDYNVKEAKTLADFCVSDSSAQSTYL